MKQLVNIESNNNIFRYPKANKMEKNFINELLDLTPDMKERLYKFVCLKDIISESIWYLLTGILTITASTNYIVSKGCNGDVKQMQERHADFERQLEKDGKISKKDEERIYYVTD